jgi:mannose-6-phosphate isomerase-like protein (cupin superfamily)
MKSIIKPSTAASEYYFREGCYITELSNSADDPSVSIARARVEPGKTTRWHYLVGTCERYVIISGSGLVEIGTEPAREVRANDVVIITEQCPQRITNIGSDQLIFLAICSPRFSPENYRDIDSEI